MGHSSVRVTQDIYIHVSSDIYDRFYDATQARPTRRDAGCHTDVAGLAFRAELG
jgi:hypothetical protein